MERSGNPDPSGELKTKKENMEYRMLNNESGRKNPVRGRSIPGGLHVYSQPVSRENSGPAVPIAIGSNRGLYLKWSVVAKNAESENNIPVLCTSGLHWNSSATKITGALHPGFQTTGTAINNTAAAPRNTLSGIQWICRTSNGETAAAPRNLCSSTEHRTTEKKVQRTETLNGNEEYRIINNESGKNIPVLRTLGYNAVSYSTNITGALHLGFQHTGIAISETAAAPRYEFTGELRRKEIWQFPLPVIRELLLNAIIHKDYRNPTDIMIKVFDESIQFVNPGALMGGLNPEDLMKGNYIAMHRNKLLAEAFYLRGDIEKFGTGFFRIQSELKDSPEVSFKLESLNGFTRSGLEVISEVTEQVKDLINNIKKK